VGSEPSREDIWRAAREQDETALRTLAGELDWGHEGSIPDTTIDLFVSALQDAEFVLSSAAHVIAEEFEQSGIGLGAHVGALAPRQRSKLMRAFAEAWPRSARQLSFEISVLLGERFHGADSLGVMRATKTASETHVRSDIVHGLQHFVYAAEEEALKEEALGLLEEMTHDGALRIRSQAIHYLSVLRSGAPPQRLP
jgi:hypothetical protein